MDEENMFDLSEVEESQDVEVTEEVTEETPVIANTPDLIAPPPVIEEGTGNGALLFLRITFSILTVDIQGGRFNYKSAKPSFIRPPMIQ